jgi:Domain of Unknown Function (DUF1259)
MKRIATILTLIAVLALAATATAAAQNSFDPVRDSVAHILQTPAGDGGGYARYNFPRTDLKVMVGDVTIAPSLAVTSWAGFVGTPGAAHAMGDIVATEIELPKVLKALADAHIDVTAIHDHLNGEIPRLAYVHFHAMGAATDIGRRLDGVFMVTGAPRPGATATSTPAPVTIDSAQVFQALGKRGKASGGVASLGFMLVSTPVMLDGQPVFPALAYGTPIAIQQVSPTRAVATGDFSVLAAQVQPIIRALAANGITATAVHSHLVGAEPNVYYIHFWADAPLETLLKGIRAALDAAHT